VSIAHVVGVDPGLVHTGVVSLLFKSTTQVLEVEHILIPGPDAGTTASWIQYRRTGAPKVYIEQYRPRQSFGTDTRMVQAEQDMRRAMPYATFLPNMGIKRVVTKDLMKLLQVWDFTTPTHHQDLRSAARIALLGMMKDDETNVLLADVVRADFDGSPWAVHHV
jgi:hypothetical protein